MKLNLKDFAKRVYAEVMEEDITTNAAQVAFYFIFALFPLLLFLMSVAGLVLDTAEGIRQELFAYLRQVAPESAISLIENTLNEVTQSGSGGKLTFGALLTLWSASAGVDNIRIALNDVYDLEETRPWWKYKLTSLLLTLGIALLLFFTLGIVFYGASFINLLLSPIGLSVGSPFVLGLLSFVVVIAGLITAFALIYSFAPNHKTFKWRWISPGAIVGVIAWLLVSGGFRIYLSYFDTYAKTYGSVGAIIVLLLWLYLTALVILLGGIVNHVGDQLSGADEKASDEEAKTKDEE